MIRLLLVVCLLAGCMPQAATPASSPISSSGLHSVAQGSSSVASEQSALSIFDPSRVTKKPFGIRIDPQTSPIQPERFSGYHTGTDFEVFAGEDEETISVPAICDGEIVTARRVSGYGGVLIQRCTIDDQAVTVLYGHLDVNTLVKGALKIGDAVGFLGKGFSAETDNERPHLHLSIHKGNATELRGYVQSISALDAWLDPLPIISR